MAGRLRLCSIAEVVGKLQRAVWTVARQRDSHVMMVKTGYEYTLTLR
jgi:predicted RNA binding protein YcfA (HicA-like mRNA interferase family)